MRHIFKFRFRDLLLMTVMTSICFSCVPMDGARPVYELPSYPQNQEVMHGIFRLRVEQAHWTDSLDVSETLPVGSVPEQAKAYMPKMKPEAKFLVVLISVTNTSNKAFSMKPLLFSLKSNQGVEYAPTAGDSFGGNLGPNLNPNMPVKHKIVFDVPNESYNLVVSQGINPGGRFIVERENDIFKWNLTPSAK